ncbi:MAG: hypothetical protein WCS73_00740 [Lentisphaeria bacterium]
MTDRIGIIIFIVGFLGLSLGVNAQLTTPEIETVVTPGQAVKYKIFRGEYLRTKVVDEKIEDRYECILAPNSLPDSALLFQKRQNQICTEVKVYQAVQMIVTEKENIPTLPEYRPLRNRVLLGKETSRNSVINAGFWSNEKFLVNDIPVVTDKNGMVVDKDQILFGFFRRFDNLNTRIIELRISHATMEKQVLTIYRTIPRRKNYDEHTLDERISNDILFANGIDFVQLTGDLEREKLEIKLAGIPPIVKPNAKWAISISIKNAGKNPTCCLMGRIFSHESWLNGRLFYFGVINPGETRNFTRKVQVPKTILTTNVFWDVAFCDSWNPLQKMRQKFHLKVQQ